MQRDTRTALNQTNRPASAQANRAASGQSRAAGPQENRNVNQLRAAGNQPNPGTTKVVVCRKCKSPQIVANKRGFSFANMFKTLGWMVGLPLVLLVLGTVGTSFFMLNMKAGSGVNGDGLDALIGVVGVICFISISLSLPASILIGFVGRSDIVNGCMNCGFRWKPLRRK